MVGTTTVHGRGGHHPAGRGLAPPMHVEVVATVLLLGLAIFVAEGNLLGPLPASVLAVLVAAVALLVLLVRAAPVRLPVGLRWLLAMLAIGTMTAAMATAQARGGNRDDLVRDIAILGSYIAFLLTGYYLAREHRPLRLVWWVLLVLGGVRSVNHLWLLAGQISAGVSDLYVLRLEAGRGEQIQLVAVVAAYLLVRGRPRGDWTRRLALATALVCVVSMTLTLSRVLLLQLIIVAMVFAATRVSARSGNLRLMVGRALSVMSLGVGLVALLVVSLQFVSEPAYRFVYDGFVSKLFNSWNEIASTSVQSAQDIDQNYRAFESERGMQLFSDADWFGQWFGLGWGTAVPLGLDTASTRSEFVRTEAAFLHNGYVNYLVKVGMVGVACYLGFMLRLLHLAVLQPGDEPHEPQQVARRQAVVAMVLCLAAASLTTGGLGFPSGFLSLALLLGTCLYTPSRPAA